MTAQKRPWHEPLVRSIDQLTPAYGDCKVGTTPIAGGPVQCNAGNGAQTAGACSVGNGAKTTCLNGSGVKV